MSIDRVVIEMPGHPPIVTTSEGLRRAAARASGKDRTMSNTDVAEDQLRSIIERIEAVEEEKKAKSDDLKEIYSEAKSNGYETKALRKIVRLRRLDGPQKAAHEAVESILETYMAALGM